MKILKLVDEEIYARIGKAYLICSQYPEVFGDVTLKKICSMFVDVINKDEDNREKRIKAQATQMYEILRAIDRWYMKDIGIHLQEAISGVLDSIGR